MVKSAEDRIQKFKDKNDSNATKIYLDNQKDAMNQKEARYLGAITKIEKDVKGILESFGVLGFDIAKYLAFAREIYRAKNNFGSVTLMYVVNEKIDKYLNAGLMESYLIKIASSLGINVDRAVIHESVDEKLDEIKSDVENLNDLSLSEIESSTVLSFIKAKTDLIVANAALEATLTAIKGSGWSTETLKAIKAQLQDTYSFLLAYIDQALKQASSPTFAGLTLGADGLTLPNSNTLSILSSGNPWLLINSPNAGNGVLFMYNTGIVKTNDVLRVYDGTTKVLLNLDPLGTLGITGNLGVGTLTSPYQSLAGRNYLTIIGSASQGVLELATREADASDVTLGQIAWVDVNNVGADKRVAQIYTQLLGSTANNRGGKIYFAVKADDGALTVTNSIDVENGFVNLHTGMTNYYMHDDYGVAWAGISLPSSVNGMQLVAYNSNPGVLASRLYVHTNSAWHYIAIT